MGKGFGVATALIGLLLLGAATSAARSSAPQQSAFVREDGIDRHGNDLGASDVGPRDFQACAALCAANARCQAFTVYTPPPADRGYCWLKHTAGPAGPGPDSISGVRPGGGGPAPRPAAPPPPRPVQPAPPADCNASATGCEFGIVSHMPGYSAQNGYVWSSSGPWQNRIRLFSRPHGQFTRPVTVCGRRLFAGPDQMNRTVQGWLNPLPEALATRFSLQELQTQSEICSWRPGGRGGSLG